MIEIFPKALTADLKTLLRFSFDSQCRIRHLEFVEFVVRNPPDDRCAVKSFTVMAIAIWKKNFDSLYCDYT